MRIAIGGISHETSTFVKGVMIHVDAKAIQTHDFARLQYQKRRGGFLTENIK